MAQGKDRPPAFQFYPREFLTSRAVLLMSAEERGGYVMLMCHGWLSPRPGWLPDDDSQLAALSGLLGRWSECRQAIARAFSVRKGWWVQPRMVSERRAQKRRRKHRVDGALATNEMRWGKTSKVAERSLTVSPPVALHLPLQSATASASAGDSKSKEESKALRAAPAVFVKPTLIEVRGYCDERALAGHRRVDAAAWFDHYESNGWRVGKNPMRDWRAAVRTWERSEYPNGIGTARSNGKVSAADIRAFRLKLEAEEAQS